MLNFWLGVRLGLCWGIVNVRLGLGLCVDLELRVGLGVGVYFV